MSGLQGHQDSHAAMSLLMLSPAVLLANTFQQNTKETSKMAGACWRKSVRLHAVTVTKKQYVSVDDGRWFDYVSLDCYIPDHPCSNPSPLNLRVSSLDSVAGCPPGKQKRVNTAHSTSLKRVYTCINVSCPQQMS